MIDGKKILALIPAREGSKGIKGKNIVELVGKPLIAYTIEACKNSKYIDSIVLTTDSEKIADVAIKYGCRVPFMRPAQLAEDNSKTIDAVIHSINTLREKGENYEILILLQPTHPLRDANDIDNAIKQFINEGIRSLASINEVKDHPILVRSIDNQYRLNSLLKQSSTIRRQEMPKYYKVNGAIYINYISDINENTSFNDNENGFIMDKIKSIDIDEHLDLFIAEVYIKYLYSSKK